LIQQEQKKQNLLLYFITTIAFELYSSIIFFRSKTKEKKLKPPTIQSANSKKLHDELANDVYQTMAFVEMQDLSYSYNKETLLDNLDTIYSRTRNISKENTIAMGPDYIPNLKRSLTSIVISLTF
jgi:hypothetical protein